MNTQMLDALKNGAIVCNLDHLGLIEFVGDDAQTFLQGQLTNDTKLITETSSQIAGYCTAKGRLLATLLLWKSPEGFCGQLHEGISAAIQKRLSMFVLRSKVKVSDASTRYGRIGVTGKGAELALAQVCSPLPQQPMETLKSEGLTVIRLHGRIPRFELVGLADVIAKIRTKLASTLVQADAKTWEWLEIQSGIAQVGPNTQEEFVPQMLNLDLLNGINFKKGCYTGQEIVARTHYLGKVKRRTHLAHVNADALIHAGEKIFGKDSAEPVGMVVNAATAPDGGVDLLAEIRLESLEAGEVRVGTTDGPTLRLLELPYGF